MRPIRDIAELQENHLLYHSAFGFAVVSRIGEASVQVEWENPDENLPTTLTRSKLLRVYSLCTPGGFFSRAYHDSEALREILQVEPLEGLRLLLADLPGPQHRNDIRDWLTSRDLMTPRAYDRWWKNMLPMLEGDPRFSIESDHLTIDTDTAVSGPLQQLDNPSLNPSRRVEISLQYREELGEEQFLEQVIHSWKTGNKQVRDLAMAALKQHHPQTVLAALLTSESNPTEALIHAIRRAGWRPGQFDDEMLEMLYNYTAQSAKNGGPLDNEGRLAAAILRWGAPGLDERLIRLANEDGGQRLLQATFSALAPKRALRLANEFLPLAVEDEFEEAALWLAEFILEQEGLEPPELGNRLLNEHEDAGKWVLKKFGEGLLSTYVELPPQTMEIDLEPLDMGPTALIDLPPPSPSTWIQFGCALARALIEPHNQGRFVNPTSRTLQIMMDGRIQLTGPGIVIECPKPHAEAPSMRSDVYAAGILLLEVFLGRPWPREIAGSRAIPYLRSTLKNLPHAGLAPLDAALHPDPALRPQNSQEWFNLWADAAKFETRRFAMHEVSDALLEYGYDTHIGYHKILFTQTNQDSLYAATKNNLTLLAVCDGISTANAGSGDVASGITTHVVASLWEQALGRLIEADNEERCGFLTRSLRMANRAVCEAAHRFAGGQLEGRIPMGTTAAVAISHGNHVNIAWLGDSRIYLVGPYGASLLTTDMNQAGERLHAWVHGHELTWDPTGYALVGYVGHFNEWLRSEALPPEQISLKLMPGECLVMCSDGITDYLAENHPQVARMIAEHTHNVPPLKAARTLINKANEGGGGDNATVIVARLDPAWQSHIT